MTTKQKYGEPTFVASNTPTPGVLGEKPLTKRERQKLIARSASSKFHNWMILTASARFAES